MTDTKRKKEKRFAYKVGDIICNIGQTNWWHKVIEIQGEQVTLTQAYSQLDPSFPECVQEDNSGMEVRTKDSLIDGYYHVMDMNKWKIENLEMRNNSLQHQIDWRNAELEQKKDQINELLVKLKFTTVTSIAFAITTIIYILMYQL